ncbi:MAG TPA: VCBS repeat-containing protein [Limnochordales bacterium]
MRTRTLGLQAFWRRRPGGPPALRAGLAGAAARALLAALLGLAHAAGPALPAVGSWLAGLQELVVAAVPTAQARGWQRLSTATGPAPYLLQLVAADLEGDGTDELVAVGRNYELREDRLYVLGCQPGVEGCQLALRWRGPAWGGPLESVALTAGRFTGQQRWELFTAAGSVVRLWAWVAGELRRLWEGRTIAPVDQAVAVELPGHQAAVAMTLLYTRPLWHVRLGVFRWDGQALHLLAPPVQAGPVRSMTALDLLGDGLSELVLEVGRGANPGLLQLWRWDGTTYAPAGSLQVEHAAIFALGRGSVGGPGSRGEQLLVADSRGRVALYAWEGGRLAPVGPASSLGRWNLVSAVTGDLDGDGTLEAVVAEYPNRLHVLRWQP